MKLPNKIAILSMALCALAGSSGRAQSSAALYEQLDATAKDLAALWGENACETIILKKKGHPLVSIACDGSFNAARREKFVDTLLKNSISIKKETYKLRPQNGMYLYQAKYARRNVYFKLFVRNAFDLWPKNPVQGKQIAVYVQNVRASADLVRWRTLGAPLTFGITMGRSDTRELIDQVVAYGDEVWLAIPLEDENTEIADGRLLTIGEALDSDKLAEYLSALEELDGVVGMSPLYCSRFCRNVPALRALFTALKEKNDGKELILLDTEAGHSERRGTGDNTPFAAAGNASSFLDTARVMNFRAFRAQSAIKSNREFCTAIGDFAAARGTNATRIVAVDAADTQAYNCLKGLNRKARDDFDFVKVSTLSTTNVFR